MRGVSTKGPLTLNKVIIILLMKRTLNILVELDDCENKIDLKISD